MRSHLWLDVRRIALTFGVLILQEANEKNEWVMSNHGTKIFFSLSIENKQKKINQYHTT